MLALLTVPWITQAQVVFNFENNAIPADWTNDATYPWVVTNSSEGSGHHGTYCMKCGNTGVSSSESTISATFTFVPSFIISGVTFDHDST